MRCYWEPERVGLRSMNSVDIWCPHGDGMKLHLFFLDVRMWWVGDSSCLPTLRMGAARYSGTLIPICHTKRRHNNAENNFNMRLLNWLVSNVWPCYGKVPRRICRRGFETKSHFMNWVTKQNDMKSPQEVQRLTIGSKEFQTMSLSTGVTTIEK
jgi:hypothetical protein